MIRKPRNPKHTIKAYYIINDIKHTFWCKENKINNITNEMGASMPMANGESILTTASKINFATNETVIIGSRTLLVQDSNGITDPDDLNALRGRPSNNQSILVR